MSLNFINGGILSTVQDLGREKFKRFGINPNGAMDKAAVRLINILLGNSENEAVLEMHFPAPVLEFEENALIAIGGADFGAEINGKPLENWRPIFAEKGQKLSFSKKICGNRAYLAVKGGFGIKKWLESASTNLQAKIGGFEGRSFEKGDKIRFREKAENKKFDYFISKNLIPEYVDSPTIKIIAGEEFDCLTGLSEVLFLGKEFIISKNSNRMGFQLSGEPLYLLNKIELISSAVDFGTIQLLPDGQMIILMSDHQTTGGFPRIAHVISKDLPILSQLGSNDKVRFELVSLKEAEDLTLKFEKDLIFFKSAVNFKNKLTIEH